MMRGFLILNEDLKLAIKYFFNDPLIPQKETFSNTPPSESLLSDY